MCVEFYLYKIDMGLSTVRYIEMPPKDSNALNIIGSYFCD